MADATSSILIIEETPEVAEMLQDYFQVQDYRVVAVNWGEDGLTAAQEHPPDLVLLNIHLPDIDGFEVARRLRARRRTQDTPIIFLTRRNDRAGRLRGLEMEAEDYVSIPFDIQELRLRVRNALRRSSRGSLTNPVTGLPEGALVDERLSECMQSTNWAMLVIHLHYLESFRDLYGFVAADDVLRAVATLIQDTVHELGSPGDFIGHLNSSDFLVVTEQAYLQPVDDMLTKRLAPSLGYFYREKDRLEESAGGRLLSVTTRQVFPSRPVDTVETFKKFLMQPG